MIAGKVPSALDLATGLGKTSVMAIWLMALAAGAPLPRRLVYVVDRRSVVDQASAEAARIGERANRMPEIAQPLGLSRPLAVSTLRGRFADEGAWTRDPAAPAIIVGTVDMIGSRLLFEGYGVSRRMRPRHAGLLGVDALALLDEAHLVPPFAGLLREAAALAAAMPAPRPTLRVMALSATLDAAGAAPFGLAAEDLEDAPVARRLGAAKALERRVFECDAAAALTACARELIDGAARPVRVVVFCERRAVAETVHAALVKAGFEAGLLVGGRRVRERALDATWLARAGFVGGAAAPEAPVALVATAAGEVGVDLDADHMVCDLVAWERMVQRLGRVNRRGEGSARVIVLDDADPEAKPLRDGADRKAVRALLDGLPARAEGGRDASPRALAGVDAALAARGRSKAPLRPKLTAALVEGWSMTGLEEHPGRPEPGPWLRGWVEEEEPQVALLWRARMPWCEPPASLENVGRFFEHAAPEPSELLDVECSRALDWLKKRVAARLRALHETGDEAATERAAAVVLAPDGTATAAWTLRALAGLWVRGAPARPREAFERTLAGGRLVLDAALGGLREGLLAADEDGAPPTADGDAALWSEDEAAPTPNFAILARDAGGAPTPGAALAWPTRLDAEGRPFGEAFDLLVTAEKDSRGDAGGAARRAVTLADHRDRVAAKAAGFAARLGLPEDEARALILAARLHDEGKAAEVWQRAMRAPLTGGPWAKTTGGDGRALGRYRHEFGSLLRALESPEVAALTPEMRDLVLHLIAAHHGHARPGVRVDGGEGPPTLLAAEAARAALRFARLTRRYGPWGLAWREGLLRAADAAASAEEDAVAREGRGHG